VPRHARLRRAGGMKGADVRVLATLTPRRPGAGIPPSPDRIPTRLGVLTLAETVQFNDEWT